eukprot:CAMPEP_0181350906 /NCGR_PEP_ID=MMETSP1106-20121128/1508_1 /TAXON_ID=81844 /ORGANISM="Mantoniella antarctica, Strain SL-175" /LENGTH=240 /DNA_ID=CAMNT_0023463395 /DNA_START=21 /DNA_END=745 /DNA_ORIENTATION=+
MTMLNRAVDGVVTGAFDAGYFLSCDIGGASYRGMLFSPVLTLQRTAADGTQILILPSYCNPGMMHYNGAIQGIVFKNAKPSDPSDPSNPSDPSEVWAQKTVEGVAGREPMLYHHSGVVVGEEGDRHARDGGTAAATAAAAVAATGNGGGNGVAGVDGELAVGAGQADQARKAGSGSHTDRKAAQLKAPTNKRKGTVKGSLEDENPGAPSRYLEESHLPKNVRAAPSHGHRDVLQQRNVSD